MAKNQLGEGGGCLLIILGVARVFGGLNSWMREEVTVYYASCSSGPKRLSELRAKLGLREHAGRIRIVAVLTGPLRLRCRVVR